MMEQSIISECFKMFPSADTEIEAVDLAAQQIYKEIRSYPKTTEPTELQLKISKYNYLKDLRKHLNQKRVNEMSGFIVKN